MLAPFKFASNSDRVWINPTHVVSVHGDTASAQTCIRVSSPDSDKEYEIRVAGAPSVVVSVLNDCEGRI